MAPRPLTARSRPYVSPVATAAAALALTAAASPAVASTAIRFALPAPATTSAGIYDEAHHLIRTLWSGDQMIAGRHMAEWDGRDDHGRPAVPGRYQAQLLVHSVRYVWEGVVGNSSGTFTGPTVHKAFLPPSSIAIIHDRAYYAVGYNEWQRGIHGFELSKVQLDTFALPLNDAFTAITMIAADEQKIYWVTTGGLSKISFVGAIEFGSGQRTEWSAGTRLCLNRRGDYGSECYPGQLYEGVIDVSKDTRSTPTGIAVQRAGNLLAVAHGGENRIRLFDKTTGIALGEFHVPLTPARINQIAFSPRGDLWVLLEDSVRGYDFAGSVPQLRATIAGLVAPLAIAVSPSEPETLWVAEGGARQQVRSFAADGRVMAVLGAAGGYADEPSVRDNKLCFAAEAGREQTGLAVADDRSVWVIDYCNDRLLRFGSDGRGEIKLAYLPAVYTTTVDHGDPSRVFANYLEFRMDDGAPLSPGRGWRLVRNWLAGLPAELRGPNAYNGRFGGFRAVETLADGHTIALISSERGQALVELPPRGPLRVVTAAVDMSAELTGTVMYENGDLGFATTSRGLQRVYRRAYTGFDARGQPSWESTSRLIAEVPMATGTPWTRRVFSGNVGPRFPVTASGAVIFFDPSVEGNEGFHLGAATAGGRGWLWLASPTGAMDGHGRFQTKSIDKTVNYGGNSVWAAGRQIVYGYHGEAFTDLSNRRFGQANQFVHYLDNGLFVGQFGVASTRATGDADAGLAGNAFAPTLVRVGSKLFLYHNDESAHGGVHRWRLDGWQEMRLLSGTGQQGDVIELRDEGAADETIAAPTATETSVNSCRPKSASAGPAVSIQPRESRKPSRRR